MEALLAPFGFKRQIMSGALGGDHAGDLRRTPADRSVRVLEVKRRAGGQRCLRRWMTQGGADGVVLPGDRGEDPIVVLPLERLVSLLYEGGYCVREAVTETTVPVFAPSRARRAP